MEAPDVSEARQSGKNFQTNLELKPPRQALKKRGRLAHIFLSTLNSQLYFNH